jgi:hypothetical protein
MQGRFEQKTLDDAMEEAMVRNHLPEALFEDFYVDVRADTGRGLTKIRLRAKMREQRPREGGVLENLLAPS